MRKITVFTLLLGLVLWGCGTDREGKEEQQGDAAQLLAESTQTSFDPTGRMYVFNEGMDLAIRQVGDPTTHWLTAALPQDGPAAKKSAGEEKCVPAQKGAALPGRQGGWIGHPSWSPDGRFIAFMAQWDDANCKDDDDGDWDIWVVNVEGLDLGTWSREMETGLKDEHGKPVKKHFIVGPDGQGLMFHQASSAVGPEQRPAWSSCDSVVYSSASGVFLEDVSFIPGICERTIFDVLAERDKKISELEEASRQMQQACTETEKKLAELEQQQISE